MQLKREMEVLQLLKWFLHAPVHAKSLANIMYVARVHRQTTSSSYGGRGGKSLLDVDNLLDDILSSRWLVGLVSTLPRPRTLSR